MTTLEATMNRTTSAGGIRNLFILTLLTLGVLLIVLSLGAELLGLDLTPGFGLIQMIELLIGLTFLTLAGYMQIFATRDPKTPRSLQADIGIRLGATGLVLAYVAGLSDLIGIGTHIEPNFQRPYVGPFQLIGIGLGILLVTMGMLLYFTSRGSRPFSALEFLISEGENSDATPSGPEEEG